MQKLLFAVVLALFPTIIYCQSQEWHYKFDNGDELYIENIEELPSKLDTSLFKNQKAIASIAEDIGKWIISIKEITKIKKNTFDLKLSKNLKNQSIEDFLRYNGYYHYKCTLKKIGRKQFAITSIQYMGGEI